MGDSSQAEETKAGAGRQNRWAESHTVRVANLTEFYALVAALNRQLGHGNWTIPGRPVRLVRRAASYNYLLESGAQQGIWLNSLSGKSIVIGGVTYRVVSGPGNPPETLIQPQLRYVELEVRTPAGGGAGVLLALLQL